MSDQDTSSPLRILLIEDHADTAKIMTLILERSGLVVHVSPTIADAQQATRQQPFDLAICDRTLPDGDGTTLGRELKRLYNLKCLCLSGRLPDDENDPTTPFAAYLTKPIDIAQLLNAITQVTGRPIPRRPG